MTKENLTQKLRRGFGRKVMPYVFSAALTLLGTLFNYSCSDFVEPPKPEKPVAMLIASPTEGDAPLEVDFDGSRSYAKKGCLKEYRWDFDGNGTTDLTTSGISGAWTKHIYENAGEYNAGLVVVDNGGRISNKALEKILVNEEIVSLGQIAFWSNPDWTSDGCPEDSECNEDIYSAEIIHRIKDDKIELRDINRLTYDPAEDSEPAWSPDGTEILFTSTRATKFAIWRMSADGSNQRDISSHLVERARQAHWGSNGLIVVAYRDNNDTEAGIGIIDPDEDSFTPLYWQPNIGGRPEWPKWSPDCSEIAFAREVDKNWEVYKMNIDEGSLTNLTNDPSIDGSPDWSPDGNYLLFKSYRSGSCDLHLMDKDGAYIGILTDDSGRETDPSFSPNGEYIIFTRFRFLYDPSQIYLTELMNAGDVNKWIQLTTKGASCYPAWKPKKEDLNFN